MTWTDREIVDRLDEWSSSLPNGDQKDTLMAAADLIDQLKAELNRKRIEQEQKAMDWLRLKVQ